MISERVKDILANEGLEIGAINKEYIVIVDSSSDTFIDMDLEGVDIDALPNLLTYVLKTQIKENLDCLRKYRIGAKNRDALIAHLETCFSVLCEIAPI